MSSLVECLPLDTVKSHLDKLDLLLRCALCSGPPTGAMLLTGCGHTLCDDCSVAHSGGMCPVPGCEHFAPAKERIKDTSTQGQWEALVIMKRAIGVGDLTESNKPAEKRREEEEVETVVSSGSSPEKKASRHGRSSTSTKLLVEKPSSLRTSINAAKRDLKQDSDSKSKAQQPVRQNEKRARGRKLSENDSEPEAKKPKSYKSPKKDVFKAQKSKNTSFSSSPKKVKQDNLDKKNAKGETPLHVACRIGDSQRVQELLRLGASANTQDFAGWTPLHEVCQSGRADLARLLLESGAVPSLPGFDNSTPLHDAASGGFVDIVVLLVRHGAKKDALNASGQTPSDIAANERTRRALKETESDLTETQALEESFVSLSSTSHLAKKPVLYFHNVSVEDIKVARSAQKALNFDIAKKLSDDVTHFLWPKRDRKATIDLDDSVVAQAFMMGKWLLDTKWFKESFGRSEFLAEDAFEINGPSKSRLNSTLKLPRLLDGCHIYLHSSLSSRKQELSDVLRAGGAVMLSREPNPESIPTEQAKVPYHAPRFGALSKCSHFILYQPGPKEPTLKYGMSHVKTLPLTWLSTCLREFSLVDPSSPAS